MAAIPCLWGMVTINVICSLFDRCIQPPALHLIILHFIRLADALSEATYSTIQIYLCVLNVATTVLLLLLVFYWLSNRKRAELESFINCRMKMAAPVISEFGLSFIKQLSCLTENTSRYRGRSGGF